MYVYEVLCELPTFHRGETLGIGPVTNPNLTLPPLPSLSKHCSWKAAVFWKFKAVDYILHSHTSVYLFQLPFRVGCKASVAWDSQRPWPSWDRAAFALAERDRAVKNTQRKDSRNWIPDLLTANFQILAPVASSGAGENRNGRRCCEKAAW